MDLQIVFTNEKESFTYALLFNCEAILKKSYYVRKPLYESSLFLKERIIEFSQQEDLLTVFIRVLPPEMAPYSRPEYRKEIKDIFLEADNNLKKNRSKMVFLIKDKINQIEEFAAGLENIIYLKENDFGKLFPELLPEDNLIDRLRGRVKYEIIKRYYLHTRDETIFYDYFPENRKECLEGPIRKNISFRGLKRIDGGDLSEEDFCVIQAKITPKIKKVKNMLGKIALNDESIFIYGETGTGKECIAQAIHFLRQAYGKKGNFVTQNCAGIPTSLLESELFGYSKGAFTGAESNKVGLVKEAENGILFLDEIDKMPLELQGKLLRFVQTKKFRPVGAIEEEYVEGVKIVAASNLNPFKAIDDGKLLLDLYERLSTFLLVLPPLREWDRRDKLRLINSFVYSFTDKNKDIAKGYLGSMILESSQETVGKNKRGFYYTIIPKKVIDFLLQQKWERGNARELRKTLIRYLVTGELKRDMDLLEEMEPAVIGNEEIFQTAVNPEAPLTFDDIIHKYFLFIYNGVGKKKVSRSARLVGVSDQTFKKYLLKSDSKRVT